MTIVCECIIVTSLTITIFVFEIDDHKIYLFGKLEKCVVEFLHSDVITSPVLLAPPFRTSKLFRLQQVGYSAVYTKYSVKKPVKVFFFAKKVVLSDLLIRDIHVGTCSL